MTPQDQQLFQILMDEAKIELPVAAGCGHPEYLAAEITDANYRMKIHDEHGHTKEQARYIAHLINNAPAWVAEIQRLQRENKIYRNYIASAPDHGVVDHE